MTAPLSRPADDGARTARARCPRCGATLGTLDARPASEDGGTAPSSWYCGCCGLVLAATRE